jgi:hypothetical protein
VSRAIEPSFRLHYDDEPERSCGGTGMVAYWDGSALAGEMCPGCPACDPHDAACERELTSHGYTPCRCRDRAYTGFFVRCEYCGHRPCDCE